MRVVFEPASATVTVAAFNEPIEAELARGALAEEGIEAELRDGALVAVAWHLSNAVGGVKLVVHADDAERAEAILLRIRALDVANTDQTEPATARPLRATIMALIIVALVALGTLLRSLPH